MGETLLPEKDIRKSTFCYSNSYDPALENLKKIYRKSVWIFSLLFIGANAWGQTFTGTGNWSDAARWGGAVPASGANVTINGDCSVDINPTVGNITINAGATLTANASAITVNGDWTNSGTFTAGTSTVNLQGTVGSDVNFVGATTFYNLSASGSVKNNLNIFPGASINVTNSNNINLTGSLNIIGGLTANNGTINVGGNVSIANAGSSFNADNTALNVGGTSFSNSGTFIAGTSTITFTSGSIATVNGTNVITTVFNNVTINKVGGTFDAPTTFTVNGNLIHTQGTFNAGTVITIGGNIAINGGAFNANAALIQVGGTFTDGVSAAFNSGTSTLNLTGSTNTNLSTDEPLHNVSINKAVGASVEPSSPVGAISITNLAINTTPLNTTGGLAFVYNNTAINVLGDLSLISGQITLTANDNIQLNVAGNTSVSGGTIQATRSVPTVAVALSGGLDMTAGAITVGGNTTFRVDGNTTISNTGLLTTTTVTPLIFNGNVTLQNAGVRFASNAAEMIVNGNWSSSVPGNFTYTTSLVRFEGNTNSSINGSTQFARIRIDKGATNIVTNTSSPFTITNTGILTALTIRKGTLLLSPAINSMTVSGNLVIESGASLDMGNAGVNIFLGGDLTDENSAEPSNVAPNRRGLYIGGGDGSAVPYLPISPAIAARPTITFNGTGEQKINGSVQLRDFANSPLAGKFGIALPNIVIDKVSDTLRFNSSVNVRVHGNLTINSGGMNTGVNNTLYFGDQSTDELLINANGTLVLPAGAGLRMNTGANADGSFLKVNGGKLRMIGSGLQPVTVNRDGVPGTYYRMAALSGTVEVIYTTFNFQGASNTGFPEDPNDPKVTDGNPATVPDWHTNGSFGGFKIYSQAIIDPDNKGYNFSFCVIGANAANNTTGLTINNNQDLNIVGTTFNTSGASGRNCVNNTDPATATGIITFFQSKGELGGVYGEGNDDGFNDAAIVWFTNPFMYWVGNHAPAGFRGTDPVTGVNEVHSGSSTDWSNPKNWSLGGGLDANFLPIPPSEYNNPYQVFPGQIVLTPAQAAVYNPANDNPLVLQKFEVFIAASAPTSPTVDGSYVIQGTLINNSTGPGNRFDISPVVTANYGKTLNVNGYELEVYGDFVNNSRNGANNANITAGVINTLGAGSRIVFQSNFASFNNSVITTGTTFVLLATGNAILQEVKVQGNDLQDFKIDKSQGRVVVQGFGNNRLDVRGNLTIASGGLEMLTATPLLVNGDFIIETGNFKSNTSTVVVRGNWNNTGGLVDFASGTINFFPSNSGDKIIRSNGQSFNVVNFGMIGTSSCPTPYLNVPFAGSTGSPGLTKYSLMDNFTATGLTTVSARGRITGTAAADYNDDPTFDANTDPVQIRTIETADNVTVTVLGLRIRENGTFTAGPGVTILNANNVTPYGSGSINPFPNTGFGTLIGLLVESGASTASNGRLNVLGSPSNYAKVSRDPSKVTATPSSQSYRFRVEGTISARYYLIEYMDNGGVNLNFASSVVARPPAPWNVKNGDPNLPLADPANILAVDDIGVGLSSNPYAGSFSNGILTNGTATVGNSHYIQYLTTAGAFGASPDTIFNASFPVPLTAAGSANIRRYGNAASCPASAAAVLWFRDATGAFAGEDFDNDGTACATDPIQWKSRPVRRWDGNGLATNTAWHDPLNWSPDGVPLPNEDVILDRSILDAAYTVVINNATSTYLSANPLLFGGLAEVQVNSLRIDNSNAPINLTNNDGTKTIRLNLRNNRDLTLIGSYTAVTPTGLEATAELNAASSSNTVIEVGGNWSNRGTYIHGNSKIILGAGFTGSRVILNLPEPNLTVPSNAFYNLEMTTGRTELNSALYVINNLDVKSVVPGQTKFDASLGNQPVYISGNWRNEGLFLPQQGWVTFTGPQLQTITQTHTIENFYGLAIDKSSQDVVLNSRTLVSRRLGSIPSPLFGTQPGGLSLYNGRFISSEGTEMIVDMNTTIQRVGTPAVTTAYVKGPLGRVFGGTGNINAEYIIGDIQYPNAPVTLTINALTNTDPKYSTVFTVEQRDRDPDEGYDIGDPRLGTAGYPIASTDRMLPDPLNMISKNRFWKVKNIMFPDTNPLGVNSDLVSGKIDLPVAPEFQNIDTTSTNGFLNVTTTLDAAIAMAQVLEVSVIQDNADPLISATPIENIRGIAPNKGTNWKDLGGILNVNVSGLTPTITSQDFSFLGNGEFSLGWNYRPLPVSLISFKAEARNQNVEVSWITETEEGTSYFEVQRSIDGKHFELAGKVPAKGKTGIISTYTFNDIRPYMGVSYYRLKIADNDYTEEYSKIISVFIENNPAAPGSLLVFPNPSDGKTFNILLSGNITKEAQLSVYDLPGKLLMTQKVGLSSTIHLLDRLPQGVYIIQVVTPQKIYQQRLLVK